MTNPYSNSRFKLKLQKLLKKEMERSVAFIFTTKIWHSYKNETRHLDRKIAQRILPPSITLRVKYLP